MAIDQFLDKIDDVMEEAWNLPFTGGKRMIDIEKIRDLIDEVRLNLPQEIKDAKAIVADREEILKDARAEAESIIKRAQERSRAMLSQEEVYRNAQEKATTILSETHARTREAQRAAIEFSEAALRKSEESLLSAYTDVKNTRLALRGKTGNNANRAQANETAQDNQQHEPGNHANINK